MNTSKLKAISIAVCCLVASLWSGTQCMDNQSNILESSTANRITNMPLSSQNEIDSLAEDSPSWVSYLISPVKKTLN